MLKKNGLLIHFTESQKGSLETSRISPGGADRRNSTGVSKGDPGRAFTPEQQSAATLALLMTVLEQIGPFIWDPQGRSEAGYVCKCSRFIRLCFGMPRSAV